MISAGKIDVPNVPPKVTDTHEPTAQDVTNCVATSQDDLKCTVQVGKTDESGDWIIFQGQALCKETESTGHETRYSCEFENRSI